MTELIMRPKDSELDQDRACEFCEEPKYADFRVRLYTPNEKEELVPYCDVYLCSNHFNEKYVYGRPALDWTYRRICC